MALPDFDDFIMKRFTKTEPSQDFTFDFQTVSQEDVDELKQFCSDHNIIGVNFGNNNPKAILNMLKKRIGIKEDKTSSKTLLLD